MRAQPIRTLTWLLAGALCGCGGGGESNGPPIAEALVVRVHEDIVASGIVRARDPDGDAMTFKLEAAPTEGQLSFDGATGAFVYTPTADWNGTQRFQFSATDGTLVSDAEEVILEVIAVNDRPGVEALAIGTNEDVTLAGSISATDPDGDQLSYEVLAAPRLGRLDLDSATGRFTYTPVADLNGTDTFDYRVTDGVLASTVATARIAIAPVNDAPVLSALPDMTNSAAATTVSLPVAVVDPDGDQVALKVTIDEPQIAAVEFDAQARVIRLTALEKGQAVLTVRASDAVLEDTRTFQFTATDVERAETFEFDDPTAYSLRVENPSDRPVSFALGLNERMLARTLEELVDEAMQEVLRTEGDAVGGQLWRYLATNLYHHYPLTGDAWLHDPLLLLNSVGFGFCDDYSSVFAQLARVAGRDARVWALNGHVISEIQSGNGWQAFDANLAVYYVNAAGAAAGVEELAARPELVYQPLVKVREETPGEIIYTEFFSQFFSTTGDNEVAAFYTQPVQHLSGEIELPPGAQLEFPGRFAAAPVGPSGEEAPFFANLRIVLPQGFTGRFRLPLVLRSIVGSGRVIAWDRELEIDSSELRTLVEGNRYLIEEIEVLEAREPVELIFLVNPLRMRMTDVARLRLIGLEVAALAVEAQPLAPEYRIIQPPLNPLGL